MINGSTLWTMCSRLFDIMGIDGFIRTVRRFGQIYDREQEHGFIDWFIDKGTLS